MGLMAPSEGAVLINGLPWTDSDGIAYQQRMATVLQDEQVEVDTVRAVLIGMAPVSLQQAQEAVALVGLTAAIAALPMGMETLVGEGIFPSSLLHRLLLARALARQPDLLILDEATAGLDDSEQKALFETLRQRGMAVLVASHRPSTLALAERVIQVGGDLAPKKWTRAYTV
jgi:ABC-type bacteriocin/lantibiotic exporter with double-glycine peptidase domain